jgi:hypothetical protein
VEEQRKYAILFAATLWCAPKLIETIKSDKPNFTKHYFVDKAKIVFVTLYLLAAYTTCFQVAKAPRASSPTHSCASVPGSGTELGGSTTDVTVTTSWNGGLLPS